MLASTLFFSLPQIAFPILDSNLFRLVDNRTSALRKTFEYAWRQVSNTQQEHHSGLARPFYGRWRADLPVPALFLNTTNVGLGVPYVISELDLRQKPIISSSTFLDWLRGVNEIKEADKSDPGVLLFNYIGPLRPKPKFLNNLEFDKKTNFSLSFAVTASATFPYLMPTSIISYNDSDYFQLLDGGLVDNGGLFIADFIRYYMLRANLIDTAPSTKI